MYEITYLDVLVGIGFVLFLFWSVYLFGCFLEWSDKTENRFIKWTLRKK